MAAQTQNQPVKRKPEDVTLGIINRVNTITDRLRIIEERVHFNREKMRILDENSLVKFKELSDDVKELSLKLIELRKKVDDLVVTVQRVTRELGRTAKLNDVEIIEKVIDFFDPTSFLTEKDVIKIVKKIIGDKNGPRV